MLSATALMAQLAEHSTRIAGPGVAFFATGLGWEKMFTKCSLLVIKCKMTILFLLQILPSDWLSYSLSIGDRPLVVCD